MTALSADRPGSDPKDDLFGHAPFAESLADGILGYRSSDGLVIALYRPWGSGKSTVLNYVLHYLEQQAYSQQPVILNFNPWWFSGQDNLARTFLGQLQAVLPNRDPNFRELGELLGEFSESIGGMLDLRGITFGAGKSFGGTVGRIARKPRDVPALKLAVTEKLAKAHRRILIMIDDIDRLTPNEIRQLFTVIKALADFPNVIYFLAFEREVAVKAIEDQTGLPGERYLEKIVQVPFEIPPVDRETLRAALLRRLYEVFGDALIDEPYWVNVFYDGIDTFIRVPRDIVRLTNTLSVTYPSVVGEVNPADFIAIETLRVFLPSVYDSLRNNPEHFAGHREISHYGSHYDTIRQEFHETWRSGVPEALRSSTWSLMRRLFPKLEQSTYGGEWVSKWRRELRVCVPELFPIYFRLSLPAGTVSHSEMSMLLKLTGEPKEFGDTLIKATREIRPDGLSKARVLLERLMDHLETDISAADISGIVRVLLDIGDQLVLDSEVKSSFDFSEETRVARLVYHLLKQIDKDKRFSLLREAMSHGSGIGVQRRLLSTLLEEVTKPNGSDALISTGVRDELKGIWLDNVKIQSAGEHLLSHSLLPKVLIAWHNWGTQLRCVPSARELRYRMKD